MPRIFGNKKSHSYQLNEYKDSGNDDCSGASLNGVTLKTHLLVGVDYVPAFELITIDQHGTIIKELFFIRITQYGLIISHNPSVNLDHLGGGGKTVNSLDRNRYLPPSRRFQSPALLHRNNTLRPICNRTKSSRCRLIKWSQISLIQCSYDSKTMVFILKKQEEQNEEQSIQHSSPFSKCVCCKPLDLTMGNDQLMKKKDDQISSNKIMFNKISYRNNNCEEIRFEFLLTEDLKAFITCGLHFQIIEHDTTDSDDKSTKMINFKNDEDESNDLMKKDLKVKSDGNLFNKFTRWIKKKKN